MTKLVNFLKINFALILVCFFLPFFPWFSCEKNKSVSSIDSTSTDTSLNIDTTFMEVDSSNIHTTESNQPQSVSSIPDTISNKSNSVINETNPPDVRNEESSFDKVLEYLSIINYETAKSSKSITGFGTVVFALENFNFFDWGSYPMPICFLCCILGLVVSIKSKRRKHLFLFVCSLVGLADIVFIGFLTGDLAYLLFGYWVVAILYLVTSLLSFILWRNFFPSYN
jgi:hypothetical protein